jgi:hypothetical protein
MESADQTSATAAEPSDEYAPPAVIAEELRTHSAQVARIDGAISGTAFFIALVPGYLTYLLRETRMTLRTAALYDREPRSLQTAAEGLALRGVHPSVESAEAALTAVRDKKMPDRPAQRRSLRTWVHSIYLMLVFGGFMSPSSRNQRGARWIGSGRCSAFCWDRDLGDDLGSAGHLHDCHGLALRDTYASARAQSTGLYAGEEESVRATIALTGAGTKVTTSAQSYGRSHSSCRWRFRSASSRTSTMSARRSGSTGSVHSARWSHSHW